MPDPINWALVWPYYLTILVTGYLLGSIPFGLLITRFAGLGDIRSIGSGNIGATNVLRTGRKSLAALTLLLDAIKGTAAVLIASNWGPDLATTAGFGAFLGHTFPIWLKFKGGKGVATFLGILAGLHIVSALVFGVFWLLTAVISRYSSLSALVASFAATVSLYAADEIQYFQLFVVLTIILWLRHRANVARLVKGTESKIEK